ncbi:transposase [Streptomyces sp. NRRL F-2664]|uniref:transposase n=1 Tax=Streptomyces sp. NRRL F-2664 TaxID=1463842 RepID=UPI003B636CA8
MGPLARDTNRQKAQAAGFDNTRFTVDWENRQVVCPEGRTTTSWRETTSHPGTPVVRATFARRDCSSCPARQECTSSLKGRYITLRPRPEHEPRSG